MAVKQQFDETDTIYFVSITCYNWLNLFLITNFYSQIYNWFNFMIQHGKKIVGYVIMPNHLHVLIYLPLESEPINSVIGEGKRFMAYKMVKSLKEMNLVNLKEYLHNSVHEYEMLRGKKHQIFFSNSDIKLCDNEKLVLQKLDYIHQNPVNGKWNLVDEYIDYPHSSAAFYEFGTTGFIEISHYMDILG